MPTDSSDDTDTTVRQGDPTTSTGPAGSPPQSPVHLPSPPAPRARLIERVEHGGTNVRLLGQFGVDPGTVLDFSVNSNPLGTSPRAFRAMQLVDPSVYPDSGCLRLSAALAAAHDVAPDNILVGNGSVELIWLLAQTYLHIGDTALIVGPTFGEYAAGVLRTGASVVQHDADEQRAFVPDVDALVALIRETGPRLVFLCNPNNPTGQMLEHDDIRRLLSALGDALLLVDEAYVDLADGVESVTPLLRDDARLVVLRSLTKSHGLAGLRLGYLVAAPEITAAVAQAQPPWTVNAFAQAAGIAALGDDEHLQAGQRLARRARARLVDGFAQLGLSCVPTRTSYWLVRVGDGRHVRDELLRRGIMVRDCGSFGLPAYIRVASRPMEECDQLLTVLHRLVSSGLVETDKVN
jgi:histidinol-phosphate aminotransferase